MSAHPEPTQHVASDQFDGGDGSDFDEPTGPPYRAIAMVLLAAVVLAIGVGLVQLFGGDDADPVAEDQTTSQVEDGTDPGQDGSSPGQDADAPTGGQPGGDEAVSPPAPGGPDEGQPPTGDGEPGEPADGQSTSGEGDVPAVTSVPVQVFNNSNVSGLAGRTGEELRENGFAVGDVGNLPSNRGVVAESTVYYGTTPGEQQAAEAVAAQLGVQAAPRPADLATDAQGVIVIVTQDLDR